MNPKKMAATLKQMTCLKYCGNHISHYTHSLLQMTNTLYGPMYLTNGSVTDYEYHGIHNLSRYHISSMSFALMWLPFFFGFIPHIVYTLQKNFGLLQPQLKGSEPEWSNPQMLS